MNTNLACEWMSIKLHSPFVIASLTPMSNARIKEHTDFFVRAVDNGAGAIILPSINPARHGQADMNEEKVESYIINSGIYPNNPMAFSVLGPTVPNIVSIEYGFALASAVKERLSNTPVIASIINLGSPSQILRSVRELDKLNVDGMELNFSCPNVETYNGDERKILPSLVELIRKETDKPLSLKLTPYQDYTEELQYLRGLFDGLTLSNAYIGLIPPVLDREDLSPFAKADIWAPGGIYGPFERPLTYYKLFQFHDFAKKMGIDIACSGGIITEEDAIQAILLGADVVEISSGIEWNGLSVFKRMKRRLLDYLSEKKYSGIYDIKGLALEKIRKSADEISPIIKPGKATVNTTKCRGCKQCPCIDRLCFAIAKGDGEKAFINEELCSGCGWCVKVCRYRAIDYDISDI